MSNREIKFRVFDTLAKQYIYPDKGYQGHYILTLGGEFHNLQNGSGGKEYVVQQYTGFKDENGKEIYEGDIFKGFEPIEFSNGRFIAVLMGARIFDLYEFYENGSKPEVIGNIFETLEHI